MKTIHYYAGQRKRRQTGTVREERIVGGIKTFKIKKRWRESWINQKDVAETETKATEGAVDENGGGHKTTHKYTDPNGEKLMAEVETINTDKETIYKIAVGHPSCFQSQSTSNAGIPQDTPPVASGEAVRVPRDGSGGEPDMFPEIASSKRSASRQGPKPVDAYQNGVLEGRLPDGSQLDRSQPESSEGIRIDPPKLEQPRLTKGEIDKTKKRIYRGIRNGRRKLSEFSEFIGRMAERNDVSFFIRLEQVLQSRKKTK